MDGETGNQPKHERSRTRWTGQLDKIFADLVVKQIQLGNRPNNVFDKKTWNLIREEFNKLTDSNFNNNQLRKHLDVLRTRFYNLKSATNVQNDFPLDDSYNIGFDLWEDLGAQPRNEPIKAKDCPIYEQLCTIFMDTSADGKYAQSSHFEGLESSAGNVNGGLNSCLRSGMSLSENPSPSTKLQENTLPSEEAVKIMAERKRKRLSEAHISLEQYRKDQELHEAIAGALLDMISAAKCRSNSPSKDDERFTISSCIKVLDEMGNIDEQLYFAALDLFEDPNLRETFISLKDHQVRLTWLQGKCGIFSLF